MKFSKSDLSYILFSLLIFLIFGYLLYREINSSFGAGDRKIVGTISFKYKVAQRKYEKSVVWQELEQTVPVYNRDAIRTGNQSEATITLNDGTRLELDDNSMIFLDIKGDEANINFAYGSIQAKNDSTSGGSVNIVSEGKVVSLDQSDIELKKDKGEGILNFFLNKGKAKITSTQNGKTVEKDIKEQEQVRVTDDKIELSKTPFHLKPVKNAIDEKIFTETTPAKLNLAWDQPDNVKNLQIEISSDPNFNKIVKRKSADKNPTDEILPEGTFYWRLVGVDGATGEKSISKPQKISVIQKKEIRLITPQNQTKFTYVNDEPFVTFLWNEDPSATSYMLEIAADEKFENLISSKDALTTSISMQMKAGKYFARISTKHHSAKIGQSSQINQFVVIKNESIEPPKPIRPNNGERLSSSFLYRNGFVFNWSKTQEIKESEMVISSNENFSNEVLKISSVGNFYHLKERLPPGMYYWRLQGKDENGQKTNFSQARTFLISDVEVILLLKPAQNQTIDTFGEEDKLDFAWSDSAVKPPYTFQIANDPGFEQFTTNMSALGNIMRLPGLKAGSYYWRVIKTDDAGKMLASSTTQKFTIDPSIQNPKPIFPYANYKLDMTTQDYLSLRWQAVKGAAFYRVRLYKIIDGKKLMIIQTDSKTTEYKFRDLAKLDEGSFIWSITAQGDERQGFKTSPEIETGFSITLKDPTPPRIISADTQIIE